MNILITGGASGLGEAVTKLLAENPKHKVYFTFANAKENAKRLELDYKNTFSIKCDFSKEMEVSALIAKIPKFDLDVLINNAYSGEFIKSYFHKIEFSEYLDDFKTNVLPTLRISQQAIVGFRKKKKGKIITVLSAALLNIPPTGSSVYVAGKAYLEKLTKVWAAENSKYNISSNTISPSFMKTKLTSSFDERMVEQITDNHPLKKLLTVEEVAESIYYLVNASPHINGIDLVINAALNIK